MFSASAGAFVKKRPGGGNVFAKQIFFGRELTSMTELLEYRHLAVKRQANGELVSPRQFAVLFFCTGRLVR